MRRRKTTPAEVNEPATNQISMATTLWSLNYLLALNKKKNIKHKTLN